MEESRVIMNSARFGLTIRRLCHQLIEQYDDFSNTCLVGVQHRGVWLSAVLHKALQELGVQELPHGKLDITFYRDDFRTREKPLKASPTDMPFLVEDKEVILVDDVLYTGRTIQAAMTALNDFGRPQSVALLAMVDRQFNRHLPIQPDFVGMRVDALDQAYVKVQHTEHHGQDQILLFPRKPENN
ncbi:MAG: bifunctional pyr operon transcriptional regulator/uracil phosphoribosyltransferase PyrR [Bacteroidota bacterium]